MTILTHTNNMTPQEENKELIYLSTSSTKDTFTIYGCGKFNEEKKILSHTEALLLYVKLHEWLIGEEEVKQEIEKL
jgi:hypothetical protein